MYVQNAFSKKGFDVLFPNKTECLVLTDQQFQCLWNTRAWGGTENRILKISIKIM